MFSLHQNYLWKPFRYIKPPTYDRDNNKNIERLTNSAEDSFEKNESIRHIYKQYMRWHFFVKNSTSSVQILYFFLAFIKYKEEEEVSSSFCSISSTNLLSSGRWLLMRLRLGGGGSDCTDDSKLKFLQKTFLPVHSQWATRQT